ncbi:MAG: hypothetical protein LN413_00250 [Candidatus Thermoplasmatota archaeon]|nr:hypothetical protein [Candidatus Thermoplasmatota archaeon]
MIVKMPGEDVSKLVFQIKDQLVELKLVGWVLSGVLLVAWRTHSKFQRRVGAMELKRVSRERDEMQKQAGKSLISSEK